MNALRRILSTQRRLMISLLVLVVLAGALLISVAGAESWTATILDTLDRLRGMGWTGWVIFFLLQALVAMIGVLPASLLGLAAGAVYGVDLGFGLSAAGVLLGAAIAFALARSMLRPSIARLFARGGRLDRLDGAIGTDGWRLVLLLRGSPVMPFSLTSYALGLSSISTRDYGLGTLAALPALFLYVCLGTLGTAGLRALNSHDSPLHLAWLALAIIATVLLSLRIGRLIARSLRAPTEAEPIFVPESLPPT